MAQGTHAADLSKAEGSPWPTWLRVLFRFGFVFWAAWLLQSGFLWQVAALLPDIAKRMLAWLFRGLTWPQQALTFWLSRHAFYLTGVEARYHATGSGDTALAWIGMLALLLIALAGGCVWSVIAETRRRRLEYSTLFAWLHVVLRYALGGVLLSYGFSKIFDEQFSPPGHARLSERVGDMSPMGMLWVFMGSSVAYTVFAGVAEVLPGLSLLFRRTSTLGALLSAAVFVNVLALNLCYDVPVKLYSATLLVLSVYLLLSDLGRLWKLFVLQHHVRLSRSNLPKAHSRAVRLTAYALQAFVIGSIVYATLDGAYHAWWRRDAAPQPSVDRADPQSIDGEWVVDSSSGWPPGAEWVDVGVGSDRHASNDYLSVTERNGSHWFVLVSTGPNQNIYFPRKENTELHWSVNADGTATLEGSWLGRPALLRMHRAAAADYPLNTRGFHWVQEFPYNH